jgi:imidazolonepropionase-like amidohydrolase
MRHGLSERAALRALTSGAAAVLGLQGRIGVIAEGADADLVAWRGNPFSLTAPVSLVMVDGRILVRGAPAAKQGAREHVEAFSAQEHAPASVVAGPSEKAESSTGVILVRANRVYPVSGPPIENGRVVVREGKIVEVGREVSVRASTPGVKVLDVDGSLIPGLVDASTLLGVQGRPAEEFRELTPAHRIVDAIDFSPRRRRRALLSGVTSAAVTPGDRNVIGGLGVVIKTAGASRQQSVLKEDAFLCVSLTAASFSGNRSLRSGQPRSYYYRTPTTRMGTNFLVRRAFFEAGEKRFDEAPPESGLSVMLETGERDLLREVLAGRKKVRFRADTQEEILSALRIAEEFGLPVQIDGGREALNVIDRLKRKGAGLLLDADAAWGPELSYNEKLSARLPAELAAAGVDFAFVSRSSGGSGELRERVMLSLHFALEAAEALRAVTLSPARLLGVEARVGSIEPGKDADLVAIGGEPLDARSPVLWVMVDGDVYGEKAPPGPPAEVERTVRVAGLVEKEAVPIP